MNVDAIMKKEFSERVHQILTERKFTQRGRAQRIKREADFEVSDRAINMWLAGESMPDHQNMAKLAKYLGVKYQWLINGEGPRDIEEVQTGQIATNIPNTGSGPLNPSEKVQALIDKVKHMQINGQLTPEMLQSLHTTVDAFKSTRPPEKKASYSFSYNLAPSCT